MSQESVSKKAIVRTATDAGWEEGKHPRGQPENKGEFASGSGGGKKAPISPSTGRPERPSIAVPSKAAQTNKYGEAMKPAGGANFMHPITKSGAENSPLAALRKHVTGSVESGKSEPIEGKPAGGTPSTPPNSPYAPKSDKPYKEGRDLVYPPGSIKNMSELETPENIRRGAEVAARFEGPAEADKPDPNRNHYPNRWPKDSPQQKDISRQLTELHKGATPATNPEWRYKDATGVERTGYVKATREGQGSDVTYTFQRADGSGIDLVSGSRLKEAKTTGNVLPVGAKPTATDPDSPEQIAKFKNGTESLRDRMARSAETYKGTEVGAVKNAIQGAVKEGKAFSPNEAARQAHPNSPHHEIGDHVSYGNGRGGQIINLTHTHAVIQQPEGAGHSAPDTVPLEQITKNHTAPPHGQPRHELEAVKRARAAYDPDKSGKDEQPGMVTQPNSGGVLYKGRDLDKDPVGDRSMPSSDCSGGAGWPGRVL